MSLSNCIDTVYKHDPDKFLALMAGDPISRQIAFPIYAFNCEVSRIPWITTESLIAEMRLTWWSELLEAVENNDPLPDHPISSELAKRLINNKFAIALLKQTITARRWDIYSEGHEDNSTLWEYIEHTSSNLLAGDEIVLKKLGTATVTVASTLIEGSNQTITISNNQPIRCLYVNSTIGWLIT